jgi:hypothetical protein
LPWHRRFEDPIPLFDGRKLITLKQAAEYIIALPKKEHDAPEWQAAMEALILVAERNGPTRFGFMRGLNRNVERVFDVAQGNALEQAQVETGSVSTP